MPLSPETYFGSARNAHNFTLSGTWKNLPQYIESSESAAAITYDYQAQNLYFVAAGPAPAIVEVLIDGKPIPAGMRGSDVDANGLLHISENRLYSVVKDSAWGQHTIKLLLKSGTLQAFTFTFG
jgi:archaellum component FlaG (FlaF/FlaG flagellin family)